eukprot:4583404-Pleurochrysis_carterae.AAC.1
MVVSFAPKGVRSPRCECKARSEVIGLLPGSQFGSCDLSVAAETGGGRGRATAVRMAVAAPVATPVAAPVAAPVATPVAAPLATPVATAGGGVLGRCRGVCADQMAA